MSRNDRLAAEFLARQVRDLMDMGSPRNTPFDAWLADYFMRFLAERTQVPRSADPMSRARKVMDDWSALYPEANKTLGPFEAWLALVGLIADAVAQKGSA